MTDWQPISTAPKDGTMILVGDYHSVGKPFASVVYWDGGRWVHRDADTPLWEQWVKFWAPIPSPPKE